MLDPRGVTSVDECLAMVEATAAGYPICLGWQQCLEHVLPPLAEVVCVEGRAFRRCLAFLVDEELGPHFVFDDGGGLEEVLLSEVGATRSLAPELATVAYRVLQEMLTNAIRHGRRDTPVEVELHWGGELRIETVNVVADRDEDDVAPGQGLDGMRRRLESVGGRLDVRRRGTEDQTFTATAWVPVRTVYS